MNDLPPAVRLSFGLIVLTVSILVLAQALGLAPNDDENQLRLRQQLAETLAIQITMAVKRDDPLFLQAVIANTVKSNKEVISAAIRRVDNTVLIQTSEHKEHWADADSENSTPSHFHLPIFINGQKRYTLEISFTPLSSISGNPLGISTFVTLVIFVAIFGFVGFWLFIKRALHKLDPNAVIPDRVRNALNILTEGVFILDRRGQIVLANSTMTHKLGRSEKSLTGKKAKSLPWHTDPNNASTSLPWEQAYNEGENKVGVRLALNPTDDQKLVFSVNAVPIYDDNGHCQGTIASFDDISELEEKNRQLKKMVAQLNEIKRSIENKNRELNYLASRDPLSNCYNRRALYDYLEKNYAATKSSGSDLACIMVDIDHFKQVNDTYGHNQGDEVIKIVANTIKQVIRGDDIIARYGGEEFCLILPNAPVEQAYAVAERCGKKIAAQDCDGIQVTASFGISTICFGADDPEELIHQADEALYRSKENGRNRATVWEKNAKDILPTTHQDRAKAANNS